jgi:hypothetical protein
MGRAAAVQSGSALRSVTTPAQRLRQLLTHGHDDEHTAEHQPGLLEWYPIVVEWTTVRSVGGGGGGRHAPLPFNADAMDFLGGRYWANPDVTMGEAGAAGEADPENYREGFEPTVLGLESAARRGLGFGPASHWRGAPLEPKPAVVNALRWLGHSTELLYDALPLLADTIREESLRLIVRSRSMAWGARMNAQRSQCPHCYQVESVWSDEDRAVCITPTCRRPDGSRHCWRVLCQACHRPPAEAPRCAEMGDGVHVAPVWAEVPEPDPRGRGQVSDEQLTKWASTG